MTKSAAPVLRFQKMHGLGNDFVILDRRGAERAVSSEAARRLADRRWGVGCDQIVLIEPPERAEEAARIRFLNADGSEAGACGNGLRCAADVVLTERGADTAVLRTAQGPLEAVRLDAGWIEVSLGAPGFGWRDIPLATEQDTTALDPRALGVPAAETLPAPAAVSMGNPHCLFFVDDAEAAPLETMGAAVERAPLFPERTNVEFVSLEGPDALRVRVWERGVGVTQACGSGACAAGVAAARRGLTGRSVSIRMDGGLLRVSWSAADDQVRLAGPTALAFDGAAPAALFADLPEEARP